ncbi:MAG TPA: trypsin-like peptidase domain-containing protein [Anaerolineales bacterium]|nr:trypsin-like peptidase domain-containing protein [Anaerolineales bacterium]
MDEPSPSHSEQWRPRILRLRMRARKAAPFASGVLAALLAVLLYSRLVPAPRPLTPQEVNEAVAQALASATPPPTFSARVYQAIRPSLILIQTEAPGTDGEISYGLGTGVVISQMGDILTSLHVVAGASDIQLSFADGTQSQAQIVAEQPQNDIAVLRALQPPALVIPAILGNPNAAHVGDEAFAVGNPFGLYSSMSAGVISGFDRTFELESGDQTLHGLIQFDAAVNPGNSGGPLLNRNGQVIGIVTGILNPVEQEVFIGIGFAVPITVAGQAAGLPAY